MSDQLPVNIVSTLITLSSTGGAPLWSASLSVSRTKYKDDRTNYSLRSLSVDGIPADVEYEKLVLDPQHPWQVMAVPFATPRTLDLAISAGVTSKEVIQLAWRKKGVIGWEASTDRVMAEPLASGQPAWPRQPLGGIALPSLRLAAGRISLTLKKVGPGSLYAQFESVLQPENGVWRIHLTPTGIEFNGALPFPVPLPPGAGPALVKGRFRLTVREFASSRAGEGRRQAYVVELLPDAEDASHNGRAVWRAMTDALVRAQTDLNPAARFDIPAGAGFPTLVWLAEDKPGSFSLKPDVLKRSIDLSPDGITFSLGDRRAGTDTADGVAVLRPEAVRFEWDAKGGLVLRAIRRYDTKKTGSGVPKVQGLLATYSWKMGNDESFEVTDESGNKLEDRELSYNAVGLAARLRSWYGLEDSVPPACPRDGDVLQGGTSALRPCLWAFAPVERGWLQFPVPNLRPPDLESDASRIGLTRGGGQGEAFWGFVRFSNRRVDAAHPIENRYRVKDGAYGGVQQPPWSVTMESARALDASWTLVVPKGETIAGWQIASVAIAFRDPRLALRGLLWISGDRPTSDEGLPRLGAGPNALEDVILEIDARTPENDTPLRLSLSEPLEIKLKEPGPVLERYGLTARFDITPMKEFLASIPTGGGDRSPQVTCRNRLEAERRAIGLVPKEVQVPKDWKVDLPAVAWLRHDRVPLAAVMPMTRSAPSAKAALESRDLAPFRLEGDSEPLGVLLFKLISDFGQTTSFWPRVDMKKNRVTWLWTSRAVPFASVGVPGVEVRPKKDAEPWSSIDIAYRYDVPILDEAFATAAPPPVRGAPEDPSPGVPAIGQEPAATDVAASALNFPELVAFWRRQKARLSLSRADESYAFTFTDGPGGPVRTLIAPLSLPASLAFADRPSGGSAPASQPFLGRVEIRSDGRDVLFGSGDAALPGATGFVKVDDPQHGELRWLPKGEETPDAISVLGWSSDTFPMGDNGLTYDSRGVGYGHPFSDDRRTYQRFEVLDKAAGAGPLTRSAGVAVSTRQPVPVSAGGATDLRLWLVNVPMEKETGTGAKGSWRLAERIRLSLGQRLTAWGRSELPFEGFEWRLSPNANAGLRDDSELFGFRFTPLQLEDLSVEDKSLEKKGSVPAGALKLLKVIGRLDVGGDDHDVGLDPPLNLARLTFETAESGLALKAVERVALEKGKIVTTNLPLVFREQISASDEGLRDLFGEEIAVEATITASSATALALELRLAAMPFGAPMRLKLSSQTLSPHAGALPLELALDPDAPAQEDEVRLAALEAEINLARGSLVVKRVVLSASLPTIGFGLTGGTVWTTLFDWLGCHMSDGPVKRTFGGARGALSLSFKASIPDGGPARELFDGFPVAGLDVAATIALALEPVGKGSDGEDRPVFSITAGFVEVRAAGRQAGGIQSIRHELKRNRAEDLTWKWTNELRVWGEISRTSAIRWPLAETVNGGIRINANAPSLVHELTVRLSGHGVPLASIAKREEARSGWRLVRPWDLFAVVAQRLVGETAAAEKAIQWLGVSRVRVEDFRDFVNPPLTLPPTFLSRETGKEGFLHAGIFEWRTALQGSEGTRFREALRKQFPAPGNMLFGLLLQTTWIGVPASDIPGSSLLTLPALASLANGVLLEPLKQTPSSGAWNIEVDPSDVAGAPGYDVAGSHVVELGISPTSAPSLDDLDPKTDPPQTTEAALPVLPSEQFVARITNASPEPELGTEPFWIRSLLRIGAVFEREKGGKNLDAVSWVPRIATAGPKGGKRWPTSDGRLVHVTERPPQRQGFGDPYWLVVSGGEAGVVLHKLPLVENQDARDAALSGVAKAVAQRAHRELRFCLLGVGGGDPPEAVPLPLPVRADVGRAAAYALRPESQRVYAAAQRGWPVVPDVEPGSAREAIREPISHGPAGPVREEVSGIAGLQSRMALPPYAGKLQEEQTDLVRGTELVWLTQKRITEFESPNEGLLDSPPVQWLAPLSARLRLPRPREVADAVSQLLDGGNGVAQAFLPPLVARASVGERAGVSTAIRDFLVAGAADALLDSKEARFGVPAQAGPSLVRQLRTPRPGPLPPNTYKKKGKNRRTSSWPGEPDRNCRAVAGPADVIHNLNSEKAGDPWAVWVGVEPESMGVVPDVWSGALQFVFEVRIRVEKTPDQLPAEFVRKKLLGGTVRIALLLGAERWRYIELRSSDEHDQLQWIKQGSVCSGSCKWTAVLDVKDPQPPREDLRKAIRALSPGQPGEVRIVLADAPPPGSIDGTDKTKASIPLDQGNDLLSGSVNPPLGLSLPLFPVLTDRETVPLKPFTLSFVDESYDEILTSPPAVSDPPLTIMRSSVDPQEPKAQPPDPKDPRGRPQLILSADRETYAPGDDVAFLLDARFERSALERDRILKRRQGSGARPGLRLTHIRKEKILGPLRRRIDKDPVLLPVELGRAYRLSLSEFVPTGAERLEAGDSIELQVVKLEANQDALLLEDSTNQPYEVTLGGHQLSLRIFLAREPAFGPPPSVFAAIMSVPSGEGGTRLETPLFAQSPPPDRLDFVHLVDDVRKGLVHRRAMFRWITTRPFPELSEKFRSFVVKADRNGQTHLPDADEEYARLEWLGRGTGVAGEESPDSAAS